MTISRVCQDIQKNMPHSAKPTAAVMPAIHSNRASTMARWKKRHADWERGFVAAANALARRRSAKIRRARCAIARRRRRIHESALRQRPDAWLGACRFVNGKRVRKTAAVRETMARPRAEQEAPARRKRSAPYRAAIDLSRAAGPRNNRETLAMARCMERRADSALRFAATANALARRRSSRCAPSAVAPR